ncbi:hypothetical protein RUM43_002242 [Polyplax serrata]|uniref:cGMP-dependent protein kinase N-terminal coiled-coil domain-containing protein n=1 Tax=Polyplax serrata TaxID=468196 RepID=A0AAN8PZC2_POLSC
MRVCFDSLCFASHRLAEDDAGHTGGAGEGVPAASEAVVFAMGSVTELQTVLSMKDERIKELEAQINLQEKEILELRSHLDKFQSVFPYYLGSPGGHLNTLNNNYQPRARKQRAQGISAEPQSLVTIQELSQQQFPTFPKNDR